MADVMVNVLNMYGIRESINCITADNAAVNEAIFLDLELEMQDWSQEDGQIRYLAHVLNLAAQTVLKTLRSEAKEREVDLASAECDDSIHNNEVYPATTSTQATANSRKGSILKPSMGSTRGRCSAEAIELAGADSRCSSSLEFNL